MLCLPLDAVANSHERLSSDLVDVQFRNGITLSSLNAGRVLLQQLVVGVHAQDTVLAKLQVDSDPNNAIRIKQIQQNDQ